MNRIELKDIEPGLSVQLEQLYVHSFPEDERRPWVQVTDGNGPTARAVYRNGELCGLISYWTFNDFLYIEHLAVIPHMRNQGAGKAIIEHIKGLGKPVVLECEPPDMSAMAMRRFNFYKRCGFDVIDRDYIQPPYTPASRPVHLYVMCTHAQEVDPPYVVRQLHSMVYGV